MLPMLLLPLQVALMLWLLSLEPPRLMEVVLQHVM